MCRTLPIALKMVWNKLAIDETTELRHDATAVLSVEDEGVGVIQY